MEEPRRVVVIWHPDGGETFSSVVVREEVDTLEHAVMNHIGLDLREIVDGNRDIYIDHVISLPDGEEIFEFGSGMVEEKYLPDDTNTDGWSGKYRHDSQQTQADSGRPSQTQADSGRPGQTRPDRSGSGLGGRREWLPW
jgi:hypothetical protein